MSILYYIYCWSITVKLQQPLRAAARNTSGSHILSGTLVHECHVAPLISPPPCANFMAALCPCGLVLCPIDFALPKAKHLCSFQKDKKTMEEYNHQRTGAKLGIIHRSPLIKGPFDAFNKLLVAKDSYHLLLLAKLIMQCNYVHVTRMTMTPIIFQGITSTDTRSTAFPSLPCTSQPPSNVNRTGPHGMAWVHP